MHEYAGGNLALRRAIAEQNSARPDAPVLDGPPGRRRRLAVPRLDRGGARMPSLNRPRAALAAALRAAAARLDPPCATPQAVARADGGAA